MMNETTMNTREIKVGVIDMPCDDEKQDRLNITKYIDGLEKFIKECPTPMSIAIQGDWGTGKTSMINMLKERLKKECNIKCIYFNTWQYSQFNMADNLYVSFVNALVRKCCTRSEKAKELLCIVQKMGTRLIYDTVKSNVGLDVEELFGKQEEKIESIGKLKDKFKEMVKEETKENGRIVVFIDDLDRLNPEVAVELLEVIKLFMDVERCIFVLAIDYEVVVSGVRRKYGQNVSEEKCRNFFDKIIQLPFRIPVESYCLDGLLREMVSDDILEDDVETLTYFVNEFLGYNPRAYKRLANSFFLIKSVNEVSQKSNDQQLDHALIFGCLCIQMCVPKAYQVLISVANKKDLEKISAIVTEEELEAYLKNIRLDLELDEKGKKSILSCFVSFNKFLESIQENHKSMEKVIEHLFRILEMTAITSVETGNEKKRTPAIKVNKIIINGQEQPVNTPTEAILKTYQMLLGQDMEMIKAYRAEEEKILTDDAARLDSFFRNKKVLCKKDGVKIYIGVSSSTNDKMKHVVKLCEFMKRRGASAHVIWKYEEALVFDSDSE